MSADSGLTLTLSDSCLTLTEAATACRLLSAGGFMQPRLAGRGLVPATVPATLAAASRLVLPLAATPEIEGGEVVLERREGHWVLQTHYTARRAHTLAAWAIVPPDSRMEWYYLANFRNRHFYLEPYLLASLDGYDDGNFGAPGNLGGKGRHSAASYRGSSPIAENTASQDWHFAPHPTAFIFQAPGRNLLAACLELPEHGFGMHLEAHHHRVSRWEIDLGGATHGRRIAAGEAVASPEFVLAVDASEDVYRTATLYHDLLVRWGRIPDPAALPRYPVWQTPFTCTWCDQVTLAGEHVYYEDGGSTLRNAQEALTTKLLDREIALLRQQGTPFGILCIDDGWQPHRGDWFMDPGRLGGVRERIDELHRMGLKVILWWAPFDVHPDAALAGRTEWLCGGGVCTRHGTPVIDYSHPRVQAEYLQPLARLLFSDEPGCYNADGVKTDFMADKIHPELPVHDPAWRGEERFIFNSLAALVRAGRQYKPDFCHQGCTAHPWFEQVTAFDRCYDVNSRDHRTGLNRQRMCAAFQPGNVINTTMAGSGHSLPALLDHALATGCPIEMGGVLGHWGKPYSAAELALLDRHVRAFRARWGV